MAGKKLLGAHVSAAGGVESAPLNAAEIGADAFALFVKPQRQWFVPPLAESSVEAFNTNMRKALIDASAVLPHASYLINMASPDEEARARSIASLVLELKRCRALGLPGVNIHPGSFVKVGTPEEGCIRIADSINRALKDVEDVSVILENTAGQGSYLGSRFEELALVIERVEDDARVGVCIDTAHLYGAGFDIASPEVFARTFDDFDKIIGFGRLRGMHFNDTLVKCGSHVDRHAPIGDGVLGWDTFGMIMRDERFDNIPLILETPEPDRWADEIRRLREL